MGPRRAETVRLEQIETLVGRLGATETQVRMTVFPTVWPKSFRGHAAVRGVAGERDRAGPAQRRGHGADLVAGGSCGDAGGRNLHAPAAHCLATASDQSRCRAGGRRLTQAGGVPARLACMPVMDSMIEFGGEFINSSQPIRKQHTEAASPPAPAVAPARGAATESVTNDQIDLKKDTQKISRGRTAGRPARWREDRPTAPEALLFDGRPS